MPTLRHPAPARPPVGPPFDPKQAAQMSEILRVAGHPLRLQIIAVLCQGERNVNALAEQLDAPQAIVSQQLRILRMARLVEVSRIAGFANYRLANPHLQTLIRCMERCCDT